VVVVQWQWWLCLEKKTKLDETFSWQHFQLVKQRLHIVVVVVLPRGCVTRNTYSRFSFSKLHKQF
jgi:hypothetical protein